MKTLLTVGRVRSYLIRIIKEVEKKRYKWSQIQKKYVEHIEQLNLVKINLNQDL